MRKTCRLGIAGIRASVRALGLILLAVGLLDLGTRDGAGIRHRIAGASCKSATGEQGMRFRAATRRR